METLQRSANRGSVSTGYDIPFSCKFEADDQEEFLRTPSSAGNRQTWTVSMWFKFTEIGIYQMLFGSSDTYMYLGNDDKMYINYRGAGTNFFLATNRVFRDTNAFYHFVVVCDATNGTAADRGRFYVNGVRETNYQLNTYQDMDSGDSTHWNNTVAQSIGGQNGSTTFQSCGYMAEVHSVDGSALTADSFGEFDSNSGIWIPKAYSGSYGTNGFYLDYSSASDMGNDSSGNNNDFSPQNINQNDQSQDSPSNNFCIGNVLVNFAPGGQTLVRGATKFSNPSGQNWQTITGTFGLTSGKWYWEFETDGGGAFVGIADVEDSIIPQRTDGYFLGHNDDNSATTKSLGMYSTNGVIYNDNSGATGASYGSGNRVGVALDMDNRKIYFAVGNTWVNSGDPANGTNGATWNTSWSDTVFPAGSCANNNSIFFVYGGFSSLSNISNVDANGYGGFYYSPPSGYLALCTKNLASDGGTA